MLPYNPLFPTPIRSPDPPDAANNDQLATTGWTRRNIGALAGPYSWVRSYELSQEHTGVAAQPLTVTGADGLIDANTAFLFTDPGHYYVEALVRMVQRSGSAGTPGDSADWFLTGSYWFPAGGPAVCQRVNGQAANVGQPLASSDRSAAAAAWRAILGVAEPGSVYPSGGGTAPLTGSAILVQFAIAEANKVVRVNARLTVSCTKV